MPVLDYDPDRRVFFFTRPEGSVPFPGAAMSIDPVGRKFSFEDVSPKNHHNIRLFRAFYKDEARATERARDRIREIKTDLETEYAAKYSHLITGTPYRHQLESIEMMQTNDRYALLLEQGLGKTYIVLQSLRMFKERDGFVRAVVVCPNIVFQTWLHEIDKFAPDLVTVAYKGNLEFRRKLHESIGEFDILLTTYDMLRGTKNRNLNAYNGWAWESLRRDDREAIAEALRDTVGKKCDTLLADETKMKKTARDRWRLLCGACMAEIGGEWRRKVFPYRTANAELKRYGDLVRKEIMFDMPEVFFNSLRPGVIVFDEASRIVNHTSQQSKAAEKLIARRKYLLSGTLCLGRPTDMYQPMKILDPYIFDMNWTAFRDRFCVTSKFNRHIILGFRNLDLLKRKVDPFIISYRREDCLDLPDRTIVTCCYEPDPAVVALYDKVVAAESHVTLSDGTKVFCNMQLQKIGKCLQLLSGFINTANPYSMCSGCSDDKIYDCAMREVRPGGRRCERRGSELAKADPGKTVTIAEGRRNAKLQMLRDDIEALVPAEKVIIWYWYQYDLAQITSLLREMGVRYILATDDDCARRFEEDSGCSAFVGQITQGIGITLNSASTTIYYSHGLALEPRLQSMDRNMRIGQAKPIQVRDYVCRGSVEEAVVTLLQHKRDVKDFMQQRVECLECERMLECLERGVRRYGEGCLHHGNMKKAEEKRTLQLRTIGGLYGY